MLAYLILVLAALSRLLPHALHGVGINFTATGAGLLFFGSRRSRPEALVATLLFAATDVYLTRAVYGDPFHASDYLLTWLWCVAICLLGHGVLRKTTVLRILIGVLGSATGFFLLSNLGVWIFSGMYAHSVAGLTACYTLALPFYANDLISTALFASAFFGLAVVTNSNEAQSSILRTQTRG